jgi:adenylyltransferase/sulfurtransferase
VAKLAQLPLRRTPYFVELQALPYRMILFQNGRLLIHGLSDINLARRLYHQLFG